MLTAAQVSQGLSGNAYCHFSSLRRRGSTLGIKSEPSLEATINSRRIPSIPKTSNKIVWNGRFGFTDLVNRNHHFAMSNFSGADRVKGPITHVIFDMDGLLLDTEKFYTEVQEKVLARFNKTFDWSLKAKTMGKEMIQAARIFVEEGGISDSLTAEEFLVEREEMLQKMFPTSELMPGASWLIRNLHANGIPICVATGSQRRNFEMKTQRHGELFKLMHHVVVGDDPEVKHGKPSPDIFLAAAKRFEGGRLDGRKILVFEDAPAGVLAAKSAEMFVVMVPDPRLDSSFHDAADQVLSSLSDFNPSDWGLPPFEDRKS